MRKLAAILICCLTINTNAQELPAPIIKKISETLVEKMLGKSVPKYLPINLSTEQIKMLTNYYPTVLGNTGKEERLVLVDGKLYRTDLTIEELTARLAREKPLSPSLQAQVDAIERIGAIGYTSVGASIDMDKPKIKDLQTILFYLGYDIKCDGIWGPKTKQAIQDAFGIDCKNLSPWEAAFKLYAMNHSKPTKQVFNLNVKDATTGKPIKEKINVSETILNEELKEFSCEPEQLCIGLSKLSGALKFKCSGENGEVEIEISAPVKLSVDMNFHDASGGSTKVAFDTDGKIKFTNTNHGQIKGATN